MLPFRNTEDKFICDQLTSVRNNTSRDKPAKFAGMALPSARKTHRIISIFTTRKSLEIFGNQQHENKIMNIYKNLP